MAVDFPDHPFWDFSLAVYGGEGIPEACLELQDAHGVDINVILFCCWLAETGRGRLEPAETAAMCAAVAEWHAIAVRGVRAVRQRLKGGLAPAPIELSEPLRRRLATIEVQLEHIEQLMLAGSVDRASDETRPRAARLAEAVGNVRGYFDAIDVAASAADAKSFTVILRAVFPDLAAGDVDQAAEKLASV